MPKKNTDGCFKRSKTFIVLLLKSIRLIFDKSFLPNDIFVSFFKFILIMNEVTINRMDINETMKIIFLNILNVNEPFPIYFWLKLL